jgi:DNA polymerase I-like protein with 3'-5' exonuclease and polymerase domains
VDVTRQLFVDCLPWLELNYAHDLDSNMIYPIMRMEEAGLCAHLDFYTDFARRGKRRVRYNRRRAREGMGIEGNPMGSALRSRLATLGETRTTKTKQVRADDVVLRDWENKDASVGAVMRVRRDEKLVNTYAQNIIAVAKEHPILGGRGIFHANFVQSGAVTRRFRCRGFYGDKGTIRKGNTQNFSDEMKEGIVARPGYLFYKMDLASIEARMFSAYISTLLGVDAFTKRYLADPWFNPYLWVIEQCTGEGKVSKKHELYTPYKHGVLGRLYGSSPNRFSIQLREDFELDYSADDCADIFHRIDRACPFIRRFQRYVVSNVERQGYISDLFGARYYVPKRESYKAVAYLCQGSAGMVLKWWWHEIEPKMIEAGDLITNTVHDELDCELSCSRPVAQKVGSPRSRIKRYAAALGPLRDLFGLPIVAEVFGPVRNWLDAG